MLIEFKTKNFRSFKNEVSLSMVAAPITENEENVFSERNKLKLLRSAVVYGANSSGKSNLFKAMKFMKRFVINSSKDTQAGESIPTQPFRLSDSSADKPSSFEMAFICEGVTFRYGFSANKFEVEDEWLFYRPKATEIMLFERKKRKINIHPSRFREGYGLNNNDDIQRTRDNALFISVVAQFGGEISSKIIGWFANLNFISGIEDSHYMNFSIRSLENADSHKKAMALLKSVNLNIGGLKVKSKTIEKSALPADMPEDIKSMIASRKMYSILVTKNVYDENGNVTGEIQWSLDEESEGTQKIFGFSGPIFDTLQNQKILIIDEFDARLHPLLTTALIQLFHSNDINPRNAQLIFATHDTNLLSNQLFRRDQIWFTEKDRSESTDLYSLSDYKLDRSQKVRKDADYEKNYIAGKYGSIPYINIDGLKELLAK